MRAYVDTWVRVGARALPLAILIACGACSDTAVPAGRGGAGGGQDSCDPGTTNPCACSDGSQTVQTCNANGQLDVCPCPVGLGGTGGAGGTGGVGATGGTGGAGGMPEPSGLLCPQLEGMGLCSEPAAFQAEQLPAFVMFVVDRSGSMNCNAPPLQSQADCDASAVASDPAQPSKWDVVADAVRGVLTDLAGKGIYAGLTLFSTDSNCGVDSMPLVGVDLLDPPHASGLGAALDVYPPRGETPIVGATVLAYRHLHNELEVAGNRFVVLITDGAESCDEDKIATLLDVELPKSRDALTRTFVIGAPGSEPGRGLLSEIAYRGGTARTESCVHVADGTGSEGDCHYDMTVDPQGFAAELAKALEEIGGAALGCEFPVPTEGAVKATEANVNVQYVPGTEGAAVECFPADFDTPCDDPANSGWQFARNPDGTNDLTKVVVCGAACERLGKDASARVEIIVGCPPLE